jgi:hypothetical protein
MPPEHFLRLGADRLSDRFDRRGQLLAAQQVSQQEL